ncbi:MULTISPECIES: CotH kinase family protein [Bacillus]|uniref:CotH kinase family protein n=1 Tax=Bacillus TaxID=1386 RepID=UPI0003139D4D|nr:MULTISPECIES: CotH kinase family protein [Bacillus]
MKNKYIILSIGLMLVLLTLVVIFLPKFEETSINTKATYAEKVFNQTKVSKIDITLDDADLEEMLKNPLEEKMMKATIVFNGKEVKDVGIRTKGNMTLRSVAQMEDSDRYSFKIDFDQYDDSKSLYGLKKLNLNNNYSDSTQAREYLSYQLMEKMGIATPGNAYMYVTINGKEWGLYLGVEAIEETFLAQNFEDGTGDLYKPDGVGSDLKWISEDIEDYTGLNLKTNKTSSNQSAMLKFLDVINNGGNLEEVMDVDEMLRYFAVNTALVNLDHYQGSMKHNYYLYEENGIFSILPWDYNMSFGGFSGGGGGNKPALNAANNKTKQNGQEEDTSNQEKDEDTNDVANEMAGKQGRGMMMESNLMNENNINFSITTPVSGTTLEDRPLLNALLSNDEYRETYNKYLKEIATTFFTESNMSKLTSQLSALLIAYVEQDPTKFSTTEEFLEGMSGENSLVEFSVQRADSILKQLAGELVIEADTSNMGPGGENQGNMQSPGGNDENQGAMQPPGGNREDQGNMQPPGGNDENQGAMQPPGGNGENLGNMQPPGENGEKLGNMQPPNGEKEGVQMNNPSSSVGYSWQTIVLYISLCSLLIVVTICIMFFRRRRV